ncbi:histidine kinase dimerization/phospho-acceptor domain-containing protein, partial [Oleiphilus sp. HI0079]
GDLFEGLYHSQQQNLKARDRLSRMINRVRSSANALRDGVVMTNAIGQLDWWNDAATRLFGFDEKKDQAQLITNLFRDPEFIAYFEQKQYDDPLEINSPTDPNLILRIHITLFGEDERLMLAQDITRLHHLEQMRKDFVSNVSHEMRTPLTVIRGYVETMLDSPDAPSRWQRALRSMEGQTQRLEAIISDLMLLEKYESKDGSDMEGEVDMSALIQSVCKDAELYSGDRKHSIRIELDSLSTVWGIESQLR